MADSGVTSEQRVGQERMLDFDGEAPDSASIMPLDSEMAPGAEPSEPKIDPMIAAKLKRGPEQQRVVGPLVEFLVTTGWSLDQMVFGRKEWRVPRNPSESYKRDKNSSFKGYPCDVVIFDSPARVGDPGHVWPCDCDC
jgi:hypothetical protein